MGVEHGGRIGGMRRAWLILGLVVCSLAQGWSQGPITLKVDFGKTTTPFRPLHGINKGPQVAGGLFTVTQEQRALGVPFTRLHDCHWPNPDVVDIHAVFPNPKADPAHPASYDFALTDDYLAAVRETGAQIIYRLGESIEHTRVKRFVHPPADINRWADVCLGIIRHYNEGWANGFQYNIRYWEIWNEPENRPAMWSGTDQDYLRLYQTTARKIKSAHPGLKVGGPGLGSYGQFKGDVFEPSGFLVAFLDLCKKENVPLDFFSWHCYTANPSELAARARAIRSVLDAKGFQTTESHLNEWNYLPNNSWKPMSRGAAPGAREEYLREMAGPAGAAFLTTALLELQDAPVDVCNLFHGEVGGFGLFSENGVPAHNYYALLAFNHLCNAGVRVFAEGSIPGRVGAGAVLSADQGRILLSNFSKESIRCTVRLANLPWGNECSYEVREIDAATKWERTRQGHLNGHLQLALKGNSVVFIEVKPGTPSN